MKGRAGGLGGWRELERKLANLFMKEFTKRVAIIQKKKT